MEFYENEIGFKIKSSDNKKLDAIIDDIFDYLKISKIFKNELYEQTNFENYITFPTARLYYHEDEISFHAHAYSSVGDRSLYVREFLPLRDRILHKYKPKILNLIYDVDMNEKERDKLAAKLFKEDFEKL